MEEQQVLMFEKIVKISEDEDLKALIKKLFSDKDTRWIMLELGLRLEAICEKLRDAYIKILIDELYNKIKQDKDFKELIEKYEVKNKNNSSLKDCCTATKNSSSEERRDSD